MGVDLQDGVLEVVHHTVAKTKVTNLITMTVRNIPYILKSNPHSVFGNFLNGKKLVRGSNPHLSFNRSSPTGQPIK
jgi:hypothetical protein